MQNIPENLNKMNGKKSLNDLKNKVANTDMNDIKSMASDVRESAEDFASDAQRQVKEYAQTAYSYARNNPGTVALAVAGIGLVIGGLIFGSRRRR